MKRIKMSRMMTNSKTTNLQQNVTYDDKFENNEFTTKSSVQIRTKLITFIFSSSIIKRILHMIIFKRKRENAIDEKKTKQTSR